MKTITLEPGTTNIYIKDVDPPEITTPTQIVMQVLEVGICGTDREEASGGRADAPPGQHELIIGHEMIGQVIETGEAVTSAKKGDYGVLMVRRGCENCKACKNSRSDMCFTGNYTERGIKGKNGYDAEKVVDEEQYFIKIPENILKVGVLTEPLSIIEKAIEEAVKIQSARLTFLNSQDFLKGKKALIAGLGPVGLLAAIALKIRGAELIGLDIVSEDSNRVEILKLLGGVYFNDKQVDITNLEKNFGQIDLIIEATGFAQLEFNLLDALGVNGIYVLTGIPGGTGCISISGAELIRQMVLNNQVLVGSVNAARIHYETAVKDLQTASEKWPGLLEQMITSRYSIEDFHKALTNHDQNEIKAVIEWSKASPKRNN